jgi:hypothetical protein
MVDKLALDRVFLQTFQFSSVSTFVPVVHIRSLVCLSIGNWCCMIVALTVFILSCLAWCPLAALFFAVRLVDLEIDSK